MTICHKGQTAAEIANTGGARSIAVISIWSQIQIGRMLEEIQAWLNPRLD